jgi:hypothetical protein
VRLLLQGRYEYFLQYHASRPVYGALLAAGVEIHEYATSFLHAKVAVVDTAGPRWGRPTWIRLSLLLAREANVVVLDAPILRKGLRERLELAMTCMGPRCWRRRRSPTGRGASAAGGTGGGYDAAGSAADRPALLTTASANPFARKNHRSDNVNAQKTVRIKKC